LNYGWVNFPLAYTQVATIAVGFYFFACLLGRQYLIPPTSESSEEMSDKKLFSNLDIPFAFGSNPYENHTPDFYIPFFTLIEIFCYMGWIKVAETLLNPFGNDDDNFQMNYLIDRNLQVLTHIYIHLKIILLFATSLIVLLDKDYFNLDMNSSRFFSTLKPKEIAKYGSDIICASSKNTHFCKIWRA
jgi:hypothetical protein